MSKKDTLKQVVKKVASKATFGTDPTNPWSMKANINEDRYLDTYLSTRGINPKFVAKNIKVAHSKSNDYLNWRKSHVDEGLQTTHTPTAERNKALVKSTNVHKEIRTGGMHQGGLHTEETDKKDMVCFDIPVLIRVLEFTREEMSSDIELHNMVERLINMRETCPLTMNEYDAITQKLVKENHIAIAMGKMLDDEGSMVLNQLDEIERCMSMIRGYIGKDYEKQLPAWVQAKITIASDYISTVGTYLTSKNEKVNESVEHLDEISSELLGRYKEKAKKSADELTAAGKHKQSTDRWMNVMKATGKQIDQTNKGIRKALNKEDTMKSARIIKSIYKKKGIKEEMYDHEKDDKGNQSYGKPPKVGKSKAEGEDKTQSAAVLKGGTTLTGQGRDTIEIDPMMRTRPTNGASPESDRSKKSIA
jgi:hypothetical protein